MKKLFKITAHVFVLALSVGVVQALSAAKPAPEKKEESQRLISLYVDEVKSDMVTISVQTQGEVRPKTEIDLIPQVSGRIVGISESFAALCRPAHGGLFCPTTDRAPGRRINLPQTRRPHPYRCPQNKQHHRPGAVGQQNGQDQADC